MAIVKTSKGDIDELKLEQRQGEIDNDVERTTWTEHWHGGKKGCEHTFDHNGPVKADGSRDCTKKCGAELVQRSVVMKLKKMPAFADGTAAPFTFG